VCSYLMGKINVYIFLRVFRGMKGVFVVIDGVADQPCQSLGQITPLQAASTPNLDAFAKKGKIDYCNTVKKDYIPHTDSGLTSLLGYDFVFEDRGSLEAMGLGVDLNPGDLALRCNFGTIDDLQGKNVIDRRAGRTLTTKETRIFAKAINEHVKLASGFKFEFYPGLQHRGVLVVRGGFSNNISAVEMNRGGKLEFSRSLDDDEDSELAAGIVNNFVRQSFEVLDKHPLNVERVKKGLFSANVLLCRAAGSGPVRFKKIRGRWMTLGSVPVQIGLAKAVGMEIQKFKYPKFKGMDVYKHFEDGLKKSIKGNIKMLKKNKKKVDYFFIYFKETDSAGHDNKPHEKVKMIELLDKRFFGFLKKYIGDGKLVVTADHMTACRTKGHSADPVPVLSYPIKEEKEKRFTEEEGLKGKRILGKKLLEEKLFNKR
jgi:2,3-bisphosphoglycerate-independent phosphoglycerate mutase